MIRGLKPTAKINRRYATGGFQPGGVVGWSRDDSSVAMRRWGMRRMPVPWVGNPRTRAVGRSLVVATVCLPR